MIVFLFYPSLSRKRKTPGKAAIAFAIPKKGAVLILLTIDSNHHPRRLCKGDSSLNKGGVFPTISHIHNWKKKALSWEGRRIVCSEGVVVL